MARLSPRFEPTVEGHGARAAHRAQGAGGEGRDLAQLAAREDVCGRVRQVPLDAQLELSAWQVARARYVTCVAGVALPYVEDHEAVVAGRDALTHLLQQPRALGVVRRSQPLRNSARPYGPLMPWATRQRPRAAAPARSAPERKEAPLARHALERVLSPCVELDARAGDEVDDGSGDEHLAGSGGRGHTRGRGRRRGERGRDGV